jgi:hypothetical protein
MLRGLELGDWNGALCGPCARELIPETHRSALEHSAAKRSVPPEVGLTLGLIGGFGFREQGV